LIAQDAGVAVAIGADRVADPHVREYAREKLHRMLDPRVLGVRLDPLEGRLGAHALDLELGHEDGHLAHRALGEDDGALGREKAEAGEVLDVVRVEQDISREPGVPHVLEQPLTPRLELRRGDSGSRFGALRHLSHACCDFAYSM
jgi:hypothetical protein